MQRLRTGEAECTTNVRAIEHGDLETGVAERYAS